ncbi:hypothetical protein [Carboxydothermus ferrireducens]|uniref:Transposase n=1 Tax=Carboxydothermus ferrireducens DSM 11255 TaxID=1119529 RepID=A0ABX2RAU3_9THEO|nr:hypothetical protein [Carboxydothermus ferrireducens]NYE57193.1 hypothetical protein [Carboxydothermus ferrireducens DSM 11255]
MEGTLLPNTAVKYAVRKHYENLTASQQIELLAREVQALKKLNLYLLQKLVKLNQIQRGNF